MSTVAVTGSASGIGAATATRLRDAGHRVIGVDLRSADVPADLATPEGRTAAVDGVLGRCDGMLDGLVTCAGLGPHVDDVARIAQVNYFGTVAVIDGLLPALRKGTDPVAVVVSSVASTHIEWEGNPARIVESVDAAPTPGARVWAYVTANMELFAGSEQAVARALTNVVDPAVLAAPMAQFHRSLREPLLDALRAHGEPQPEVMADIVGSMVVRASRDLWSPDKRTTQRRLDAALALLRRLLGSYLQLPGSEDEAGAEKPSPKRVR